MKEAQLQSILSFVAHGGWEQHIDGAPDERLDQILRSVEPYELRRLLVEHRLHCLFYRGVQKSGAICSLAPELVHEFKEELRISQLRDAQLQLRLAHVSRALKEAGVGIVVCKGAILSQYYYPERGLRTMHDLDMWLLDQSSLGSCRRALLSLGFVERPYKQTTDACNFVDSEGIVLDVHTRFSVFQNRGYQLDAISRQIKEADHLVLVPEALVAHLVHHMLGHGRDSGLILCWLVDLVLVLRQHKLDPNLLEQLLSDQGTAISFSRMLQLFEKLQWLEPKHGLFKEGSQQRPISLAALVRKRRWEAWAGVRGKVRLAKYLLEHRYVQNRPGLSELLYRPLDWLREESLVAGASGMFVKRDPH